MQKIMIYTDNKNIIIKDVLLRNATKDCSMDIKLVITEDGSHTLSVPELNEHYHSVYGAISESQHIFINTGLKFVLKEKKEINILEIGFGTGLNALMTFRELSASNIKCSYTAVEAYPLEEAVYTQLNYPGILGMSKDILIKLHTANWEEKETISSSFDLLKIKCKAQDMLLTENYFDLVYFDAFAPDIQPELWTVEIFKNIFRTMKNNAILTTYSTKGIVKRALKESGFTIEKLPGPKGKREILRAMKE